MNKKVVWAISLLLIVGLVGGLFFFGIPQETYQGRRVVNVVPVMATIECGVVDSGTSRNTVLADGIWLSNEIGLNTKILTNIIIELDTKSTTYRPQLEYKICDVNRQNCAEKTQSFSSPYTIKLDDLDLTRNSYFIKTTQQKWTLLSRIPRASTVSMTYDKFGLILHSTTGDKVICSSSCDLSCPTQGVRQNIIKTFKDSLNFYERTNYLEYWVEPSSVSAQLGGTVWNPDRLEFCFGGHIYRAGEIRTEETDYVYPKTYNRKEECCPGAVIQITNGEKRCNNDYDWETILDEQPPECSSDFQCPGSGVFGGIQEGSDLFKSRWYCSSGVCSEDKRSVECVPPAIGCDADQICQDFKCVGGIVTPPIDPTEDDDDLKECAWYQDSYTKIEKEYGFLWWRAYTPFVNPKQTPISGCRTSGWVYMLGIGIIIVGLGAYAISIKSNKRRRK